MKYITVIGIMACQNILLPKMQNFVQNIPIFGNLRAKLKF